MNYRDREALWQNIIQLMNYMDSLKKQIKHLEKKYRKFNIMIPVDKVLQNDNTQEIITGDKTERIIFRTDKLIPVIKEAMKDNCNVCLVKTHTLFIISEESDNNFDEWNICYAEGLDPDQDEYTARNDALHEICGPGVSVGRIPVSNTLLRRVMEHNDDLEVTLIPVQFNIGARPRQE